MKIKINVKRFKTDNGCYVNIKEELTVKTDANILSVDSAAGEVIKAILDHIEYDWERVIDGSLNQQFQSDKRYIYYVDGLKYKTEQKLVTGLFIISMLHDFEHGYSLFEEKGINDVDVFVSDTTTVSLDDEIKRFYTVPPATWG